MPTLKTLKKAAVTLLRRSERYTKTDMVYLASGGFWSIVGEISTAVSTLVIALVVSHYFPKTAYGEYKYVLSIVALIGILSLNGISGAVFQSVTHGFDGAVREGFRKNMRWSVFTVLIAGTVGSYYIYFGNYILGLGILIGGCFSPLYSSANLASYFLAAKKDFRRQSIYYGVVATAIPATIIAIAAYLTDSAIWLVGAYFISNALLTYWAYRKVLALYRPDPAKTDPAMIMYGKHLSLMGMLVTIANNIDQVLLFQFVGPAQVAIYNFAIAIPEQIKGPLKTLDSMVQARFATRTDKQIRSSIRSKILSLGAMTALAIIGYCIAAPSIYGLLFPNYTEAVLYSQLYALSLLGLAFTPASSYLSVKKRIREQYFFNIITSVLQIVAMLVGVMLAGLIGVIIARVISRNFAGWFNYALFIRSSRLE